MELYKKLIYLRKEKGVSQIELAEALDVSRQAISKWEGGVAIPSIENLRGLSNFYDVSLDYLINDKSVEKLQERCEAPKKVLEADNTEHRRHFCRYNLLRFWPVVVCVWSIVLGYGIFRHAVLAAWLFVIGTGVLLSIGLIAYIIVTNFWRN